MLAKINSNWRTSAIVKTHFKAIHLGKKITNVSLVENPLVHLHISRSISKWCMKEDHKCEESFSMSHTLKNHIKKSQCN